MAVPASLRAAIRRGAAAERGERLSGSWRDRFVLLPRFDKRWAVIDREFKYDVVVFCHDRNDAEIIRAALNREISHRGSRTSKSCGSGRRKADEMF
jgi:hypothetical protein